MHSEEIVDTASRLISEVTDKSLTSLQRKLLKASWENQKYHEFAKTHKYCCDHVKAVGSKLWALLSQALGEEVTKQNFRQVFQRY
ncbi:MAG: hypothetical protein MJK14_05750, partial [Rivularia sp. ALOHA_DT_140]|nr:hypothetical protein [Rivularia sp. ALOHA_DT_140]